LQIVQLNEESGNLEPVATAEHSFPATKVMFLPEEDEESRLKGDLFASTGTALHVWKLEDKEVKLVTSLRSETSQAPLTAFDWSVWQKHKMGVSAVDTTIAIWNVEREKMESRLIAHDKAVYDFVFLQSSNLFASVGADGSMRVFDMRNLERCTVVYQAESSSALLRLSENKFSLNQFAAIATDTPGVILLDIRRPNHPLAMLTTQDTGCVNHITWAPHSRHHILCGTEDGEGLIWDVQKVRSREAETAENTTPKPYAYQCTSEVFQVQWPRAMPDYVALSMATKLEVLRV